MALPNRMHQGYYPNNPTQSPPIFDRSQLPGQGPMQQHRIDTPFPGHPGRPPGPGELPGQHAPSGYQGYGIANMFQRLGSQYDVGSVVPTGGFGFDAQQKTALQPLLQQLPGLVNGPGRQGEGFRNPLPDHMDTSGGILQALRSLGVDTGNMEGLGISGDQRAQFMHSLQDFVTGIANRPPPNRRPPDHFPGRDSPGHRNQGPPGDNPPQYYSPGYRPPRY